MVIGFVLFWFLLLFSIGIGVHLILRKVYSINRPILIFLMAATAFLCVVIYVGINSLISLTFLTSQILIIALAITAALLVVTLEPILLEIVSRAQNVPFQIEKEESSFSLTQFGVPLLKGREEDSSPFTLEGKVKKEGVEQVRVVPHRSSAARAKKTEAPPKIREKRTKEKRRKAEKKRKKEAVVVDKSLNELLSEAYKALDSDKYELALENFQLAVEKCPEENLEVKLLFEKARIFDLLGKGKKAMAELKKAKVRAVQIGDTSLVAQSEELLKFLAS